MRRLPALSILLATALVTGLAAPPAPAQQSMQFRPVPAESAARLESNEREIREATRRMVRQAARSAAAGGSVVVTPSSVTVAPGTPPAPAAAPSDPAPPKPPAFEVSGAGDIIRIGRDIHIARDQVVNGSVTCIRGDVEIEGQVHGDVLVVSGDIVVRDGGRVDGDAAAFGGQITADSGGIITGQRILAARPGDYESFRAHRERLRESEDHDSETTHEHRASKVVGGIVFLIIMVLLAWGFAAIAPGRTGGAIDTLRRETGTSFIVGLLVLALAIPSVVALALVMALLCITIIGIPVALVLFVAYGMFYSLFGLWGIVIAGGALSGRIPPPGGGTATLVRAAIWGQVLIHGLRIFGSMLHLVPFFGGLGTFLVVISWLLFSVSIVFGGGALVRAELVRRTFQNWWARRSSVMPNANRTAAATAASGGDAWTATAPTTPTDPPPGTPMDPPPGPPPPPPPSPPSSYTPWSSTDPGGGDPPPPAAV